MFSSFTKESVSIELTHLNASLKRRKVFRIDVGVLLAEKGEWEIRF